jgi:hypothetical protein
MKKALLSVGLLAILSVNLRAGITTIPFSISQSSMTIRDVRITTVTWADGSISTCAASGETFNGGTVANPTTFQSSTTFNGDILSTGTLSLGSGSAASPGIRFSVTPNMGFYGAYNTFVFGHSSGGNFAYYQSTAVWHYNNTFLPYSPYGVPLTLQQYYSQSADLTQWTDSNKVVLASITANGEAVFPALTLGGVRQTSWPSGGSGGWTSVATTTLDMANFDVVRVSSMSVTGANGLGVTYGISAGTATVGTATISTLTVTNTATLSGRVAIGTQNQNEEFTTATVGSVLVTPGAAPTSSQYLQNQDVVYIGTGYQIPNGYTVTGASYTFQVNVGTGGLRFKIFEDIDGGLGSFDKWRCWYVDPSTYATSGSGSNLTATFATPTVIPSTGVFFMGVHINNGSYIYLGNPTYTVGQYCRRAEVNIVAGSTGSLSGGTDAGLAVGAIMTHMTTTYYDNAQAVLRSNDAHRIALTVVGSTGQVSDIQQWRTSASSVTVQIDKDGSFTNRPTEFIQEAIIIPSTRYGAGEQWIHKGQLITAYQIAGSTFQLERYSLDGHETAPVATSAIALTSSPARGAISGDTLFLPSAAGTLFAIDLSSPALRDASSEWTLPVLISTLTYKRICADGNRVYIVETNTDAPGTGFVRGFEVRGKSLVQIGSFKLTNQTNDVFIDGRWLYLATEATYGFKIVDVNVDNAWALVLATQTVPNSEQRGTVVRNGVGYSAGWFTQLSIYDMRASIGIPTLISDTPLINPGDRIWLTGDIAVIGTETTVNTTDLCYLYDVSDIAHPFRIGTLKQSQDLGSISGVVQYKEHIYFRSSTYNNSAPLVIVKLSKVKSSAGLFGNVDTDHLSVNQNGYIKRLSVGSGLDVGINGVTTSGSITATKGMATPFLNLSAAYAVTLSTPTTDMLNNVYRDSAYNLYIATCTTGVGCSRKVSP